MVHHIVVDRERLPEAVENQGSNLVAFPELADRILVCGFGTAAEKQRVYFQT